MKTKYEILGSCYKEFKLFLYADDMNVCLENSKESMNSSNRYELSVRLSDTRSIYKN